MVTTFKESPNGFYCSECRMSFAEPQSMCPYCESVVTNYEELLTKQLVEELKVKLEEFKNESDIHR